MKLWRMRVLALIMVLSSFTLVGCSTSGGGIAGFFKSGRGKSRALVVQQLLGDPDTLKEAIGPTLRSLPGNVIDFKSDDPARHKRLSPDVALINESVLTTPDGWFRFATVTIGGHPYALKISTMSPSGTVRGNLYELPPGTKASPTELRDQIALETYPIIAVLIGSVDEVVISKALMEQVPIAYDLLPDFIGPKQWDALGKESPKTLASAAESLLRAEDKAALPALLPALETHVAARVANPLLLRAAKSKHAVVRKEAALAYSRDETPTQNVLRILMTLSNDSEWTVRADAIRALVRFDVRMDRVVKALEDKREEVRSLARKSLNRLPRPLNDDEVKQLSGLVVNASSWKVRKYALERLAKTRRREIIGLAIGRLNDSDGDVRDVAIAILVEVTLTEKNLPTLKALSESSAWKSRRAAIKLLSGVEGAESTTLILTMIGDSDNDVSRTAKATIETRRLEPVHLDTVKQLLVHKDWKIRRHAALLLKEFNTPKLEILISERLTVETDEEVKTTLVQVLQILNARKSGKEVK
jgi:HEAT repeat protein